MLEERTPFYKSKGHTYYMADDPFTAPDPFDGAENIPPPAPPAPPAPPDDWDTQGPQAPPEKQGGEGDEDSEQHNN